MKGSEFAKTLPAGKTAAELAERERRIVQAVFDGHFVQDFNTIEVRDGDHYALVTVSRDTLRIGDSEDSIRVSLSAGAQEQIAVHLRAHLLTPKLVDLIHKQAAVTLSPLTRAWYQDGSMAWTSRMLEQGRALDDRVRATGADAHALVSNAGKDWVAIRSPKKGRAANYGWLGTGGDKSVMGMPIIQSVGTAHDYSHVDYSQLPRFVLQVVTFDGKQTTFGELLRDPVGSKLVNHDGPFSEDQAPDTIPAPPPRKSSASTNVAVMIGDEPGVPFIQAKSRGAGNNPNVERSKVDLVVIHSMEAAEKPGTALAVAKWFAGQSAPKASAHWCVDGGEVDALIQCVREKHIAWHAPGANGNGIGIEHAGFAKQTEAQWLDAYGMNMLQRSAELAARIAKRWNIPLVWLTKEEVRAGRRGFCGHVDVSLAFGKSTHTDPGTGFPKARYMSMVAIEKAKLG